MTIKCYLCSSIDHINRTGKVRDDSALEIFECLNCGLVFLSPKELPEKFYEKSGMHGEELMDPDEWIRNLQNDDNRRFSYLEEAITNRDVLDFGCGPGGFLLKAQTKVRNISGIELELRLQSHFKEKNLKVFTDIGDLPFEQKFDVITAFHVIEHLEDPSDMLKLLATKLSNGGRIIIEVPSSSDALLTLYHNKPFSEFTYWSCHLFLFNSSNLNLLAKKAGLKLDFVEHIQRYPLSNHLYWLANGKPGGHQVWSFLDDKALSNAYEARLAALGLTDTLMAGFSI
jgi:SAM-dependent methyltransferase